MGFLCDQTVLVGNKICFLTVHLCERLVGALVFWFRILRGGTRPAMTRVSESSSGSNRLLESYGSGGSCTTMVTRRGGRMVTCSAHVTILQARHSPDTVCIAKYLTLKESKKTLIKC